MLKENLWKLNSLKKVVLIFVVVLIFQVALLRWCLFSWLVLIFERAYYRASTVLFPLDLSKQKNWIPGFGPSYLKNRFWIKPKIETLFVMCEPEPLRKLPTREIFKLSVASMLYLKQFIRYNFSLKNASFPGKKWCRISSQKSYQISYFQ